MSFESTPNRRNFLKMLGAGAAAATMKSHESLAAPGYETSPLFPEDTAYVDALFKDPALQKKFRDSPSWRQVLSVIRVLARAETSPGMLPNAHEAQEGEIILRNHKEQFVGNATLLKIKDAHGHDRFFVATAGHVADAGALAPEGRKWRRNPRYDYALCEVSANKKGSLYSSLSAIDLGTMQTRSENCTGVTGAITGKNERAGLQKNITFASMISPLLSEKVIFDALNVDRRTKTGDPNPLHGEELRFTVIPRGITNREPSGDIAVRGASGSRFVYRSPQTGKNTFGGIFSTAVDQSFGKESYAIGFVVDASYIREGILEALKEKTLGS